MNRHLLIPIGISLAVALGCQREARPPRRLLVLGIDSATLTVMEPMVRRGELPTFSRFWREGAWGSLRTIDPTLSVVVWTSILTGATPDQHGIQGWLSESGEQMAFTSDRPKRPPLWRILSASGVRSLFVNFWVSWPAEETDGGMVSNRMRFRNLPYRAYPSSLSLALDRVPLPVASRAVRSNDVLAGKLFYEEDRYVLALARQAISTLRPRVAAIYLRGLDIAQHSYWHTIDPSALQLSGTHDDRAVVEDYYRFLDGELRRLIEDLGNPTIVVVSDHGMEALREAPPQIAGLNMNRLLNAMGYLAFEPAPARPAGKGMARRSVRWDSTRAYTFGDSRPDMDRGVRINLAGREPSGIVPPEDREVWLDRLAADLRELRTTGGASLITCITRFPDPGVLDPDMVAELNPRIAWGDEIMREEQRIPVRSLGQPALAHNSGQHWHAPPGILLMLGDGVKSGVHLESATVYDVAPTVLALAGLPASADMVGRPCTAALSFQPLPPIASYAGLPYRAPRAAEDEEVSRTTYDELRRLGYVQ